MICDRYHYSKLTKDQQEVYKKVYAAIKGHERYVDVTGIKKTNPRRVFDAINLDNPHFFYFNPQYRIFDSVFSRRFELSYIYSEEDTIALNQKIDKACKRILSQVTGETDYEKVLSLHDLLAQNVRYDDVAKSNIGKYHPRSNTIIGPLFYKTAVCEGIAKTFKLLCNALDIKCAVIIGKLLNDDSGDNEENHAWNVTKIDGRPCHIDLTADIGLTANGLVSHQYFNLSDSDIHIDHALNCNSPICQDAGLDYFHQNETFIHSKRDLYYLIANSIKCGGSCLEFKTASGLFADEAAALRCVSDCIQTAVRTDKRFLLRSSSGAKHYVYRCWWTFA